MEPVSLGQQVKSFTAPTYNFPATEKKQGLPLASTLLRSSIVIDLGTPNLGTQWNVSSVSLFYEELEWGTNVGILNHPTELSFYFLTILYVGNVEVAREATNKIVVRKPPEAINPAPESPSSLVALQNLPNPVIVPGGQQLFLQMAAIEGEESSGTNHIVGACKKGSVSMYYELLDLHATAGR